MEHSRLKDHVRMRPIYILAPTTAKAATNEPLTKPQRLHPGPPLSMSTHTRPVLKQGGAKLEIGPRTRGRLAACVHRRLGAGGRKPLAARCVSLETAELTGQPLFEICLADTGQPLTDPETRPTTSFCGTGSAPFHWPRGAQKLIAGISAVRRTPTDRTNCVIPVRNPHWQPTKSAAAPLTRPSGPSLS